MKFTIILGLLIFISNAGYGQMLTINDAETNQPLELVTISSPEHHAFKVTNSKGQAQIEEFKNADAIEIRLVGYLPKQLSYQQIALSGFIITLAPSNVSLDHVVVSANRWGQSLQDLPSKVISLSAKELLVQNPQTAADLLESSGEVFIQKSQQGGGSPMIRGFSTNRLLYTVDGVRMNTAIFRSGNLQNVISLDPLAMEKTEVLFGPGSVIYGSDAIGGVMSFHTLSPQFSIEEKPLITGKALSRFASANNEFTKHFDLKMGWKKWAFVSSISHNDFGDLKMGENGPKEYLRPSYADRGMDADVIIINEDPKVQTPSGYAQINLMQKVGYHPNKDWKFEYGFHYSATSDYSRYDRHIRTSSSGNPRYGEWNYGPQIWMMDQFNVTHKDSNFLYDEVKFRMAHQYFEESRTSRDFDDPIRSIKTENVDAYSGNLDFYKSTGRKSKLYYGMEYVLNKVNSSGEEINIETNTGIKGPSRYPDAQWASSAAYLSFQHFVSQKFIIQSGVRYNFFQLDADFTDNTPYYPLPTERSTLRKGSYTGSLGLTIHPHQTWSISTNFSTGFRAPNVDDMGKVFDSGEGSVVVPNSKLGPEYAYNMDFGIAKVFDNFLKLDFTAYYTLLENAMVRRDFKLGDQDSILYDGEMAKVQAVQNAADSRTYGIQTGLEMNLKGGFKLSQRYNFQKGEEELSNGRTSPSRHAAPWFGVTRVSYQHQDMEIQVYAVYNGEKAYSQMPEEEKDKPTIYASDKDGNPYSPGWYTVNFKSIIHLNEVLSLTASVENITDQRYRPYSSGLVAPGRNFIFSLIGKF